jgi:hypothetical protein
MTVKISNWIGRHRGPFRKISAPSRSVFEASRRPEVGASMQSPVSSTVQRDKEATVFKAAFAAAVAYSADPALKPEFKAAIKALASFTGAE